MISKIYFFGLLLCYVFFASLPLQAFASEASDRPNVLFILADDLGYNEIGAYGQEKIKTPNLDKLANSGKVFTQFYAGAPVCATSRSVLMTGQHAGKTRVRGNAFPEDNGKQELFDEDFTLAELFKEAGYGTALIGKWGLGMPNTQGHPNKQGFDYFYGYLSQHHAHNFYPTYLWRNELQVGLPNVVKPMGKGQIYGAGVAVEGGNKVYAPDLFVEEAERFLNKQALKQEPFFLYYATNVPHSNNEATLIRRADGAEVPSLGEYADKPWELGAKRHAAMVTRLDTDIGRLIRVLAQNKQLDNTIIVFTSDNGPHVDHAEPMDFFAPAAPLKGWKMELDEGGLRVPTIISWPKMFKKHEKVDQHAYFGDFMASFADLLNIKPPTNIDSNSLLPLLTGNKQDYQAHEYLYWEYKGRQTGVVALKDGRWKALIRKKRANGKWQVQPLELYDLDNDISEQHDVSSKYPEIAADLLSYMKTARAESENWPAIVEFDK